MRITAGLPRRCLAGLHILVVDDDEDVRDALVAALGLYGADADGSESACDARERLHACAYDLLLSDLDMPDEDGCALVASLRADPSLCAIRAAAVTASFDSAFGRSALVAGFDRVIPKTLELEALIGAVRDLADLHR